MIEDNQKYFNRLLAVFDAVIVAFSYWLAWYIKFRSRLFSRGSFEAVPYPVYMSVMPIMVIMMIILYWAVGLYSPHRMRGRRVEIRNIIAANIMEYAAFIVVLYMRHQMYWSRSMLSMFAAINAILDIAMRLGVWQILTNMRKKGRFVRNVLLVGYSHAAEEFIDRVLTNPQWGYNIRGILDDRVEAGTEYKGIKVLGRIDNLMVILPENHLDEIDITLGLGEYYRLENIVALCEKSGVHTKFIPDYYNIIPTKPYTEDLLGLPVINIRYVPLSNTFNAMLKRILDIIGSLICIALFSPVMLVFAILVRASSPGPILFRQERVGLHNRKFMMYKFRSMVMQDSSKEKKAWTVRDDPRVTKVGKFMRKTSIDELPQLFNVLKGDMSLVGPRPERPYFVEKFQEEIPRYMIKHQVRPGMTGWAQVHGLRGDTSIRKRIEYDLYYIENWTLGLDIKILFMTVFNGFVNKNAY
ncbi:MAG: undecaprenyl-phosphate glucose phosphotransferase [Eubacteriales bacterium]|nr:undecaprenyl-phosphate glucose phosphotransferase [Lachnospiraceae bacterium]MDD5860678.1 undecaprenyl-phosphate glucose phosphotransferase [Eubacteriales bacterium]MCH4064409.1 undecaprenyl-phosphate glucose phosphotransferase [Lachnospiraceae bacterium]MCH4102866.1 undecaprenyl-phosphate glucose phosphotransferase [Lachnospiraceae bacterium]MCI1308855.1 undecaprenyl-phosphate glucose phosphotransferase [Lachnospiraceae bacterium]